MAQELATTVQQQQQEFGARVKGVTVVKPIVFGNVTRHIGQTVPKKMNIGGQPHTHQWKCYLRLYNKEDSSKYIKKVQFKLHDSYPNPVRVCTSPPYEVSETGWGEFEITIKIFFADPGERPVTIYHILKLFKMEGPNVAITDYLVSEFYDELIFAEPTVTMLQYLRSAPPLPPNINASYETNFEEKKVENLEKILNAKKNIAAEIGDLKRRILSTKAEISRCKYDLESRQQQSGSLSGC